jgi:signal recognition particle subunit SRP54
MGGLGKLAAMFGGGGDPLAALGGGAGGAGALPRLGGGAGLPGLGNQPFNLPPGFDKFGKK